MNDYDCEMLDGISSTNSISEGITTTQNSEDAEEEQEDSTTLWSIDDDTMFFAQGLRNHSAGKGKSVFVTWNENYLLNFVFKTSSKTKKTSLTKVRLMMPMSSTDAEQEPEEILDMVILEMNTLLLMKSGRVYYFSSVKSIHNIPWLNNVRCFCPCPAQTQFSVIRLLTKKEEEHTSKKLILEVYQDVPQLSKYSVKDVLRRSYDISFDVQNLFNCDWICERYILISQITDEENIEFLRRLIEIGNVIRKKGEKVTLELKQEVHIFTVSGNMFVLIGAIIAENESTPSNAEDVDYTIQLLNTYATSIESIQIDYHKNLLIVLLQSGHMDIWYKSVKMFGSIRHLSHEISYFTHYDYDSLDNTFYITKPEEITQLRIIQDGENECTLMEVHKAISGMIACTWVKNLQQLICLSLNNIFYRICFDTAASASKDNSKEIKVEYENFSTLYSLTTKKLKELLSKAQIMADLMEQPKKLHEDVEIEWQKQQLLSLGFKEIWKTICKCHIEYHMESTITYSHKEEDLVIKTSFDHRDHDNDEANSMYCLIFVKLTSKDNLFLSIIQTATWHLQITLEGETLILLLPSNMINKRLCFIVKFSTKSHRGMLPDFSLNLLTFVSHCSVYLCINDSIDVTKTEQTYRHLFSSRSQITLFRNSNLNVDTILQKFNGQQTDGTLCDNAEKPLIKQVFKGLSKQEIISVLELFHQQYEDILNSDIKIYYLREHILHLSYEETLQELSISTTYPEALLYFKLFLMYEFKSSKNVDLTDSKTTSLQKIMQYQAEVEHLYGSLGSVEYMDEDSGGNSLHLENLIKVYSKIRCDFGEIYR